MYCCWLAACRMDRHFYARIVCSVSLSRALYLSVCLSMYVFRRRFTRTYSHTYTGSKLLFQLHVNLRLRCVEPLFVFRRRRARIVCLCVCVCSRASSNDYNSICMCGSRQTACNVYRINLFAMCAVRILSDVHMDRVDDQHTQTQKRQKTQMN